MKQITINLYNFEELDENAKQNAYEYWLRNFFYFDSEFRDSLKKFCDIFDIELLGYEFDECSYHISYDTEPANVDDSIKGLRLYKYIWNNYSNSLYDNKTYYLNKTGSYKSRVSRILVSRDNSYVLTGTCWDYTLVKPIHDFLEHYNDDKDRYTTFDDLMHECLWSFIKAMHEEYEYAISMEAFEEETKLQEFEFYKDGTYFNEKVCS